MITDTSMDTLASLNKEIKDGCPDTELDYDDEEAFQYAYKSQKNIKRSHRMFLSRSISRPDVKFPSMRQFNKIKTCPIIIPKPTGSSKHLSPNSY